MRKLILPVILFAIVLVLGFSSKKSTPLSLEGTLPFVSEKKVVELSKEYVPFTGKENLKIVVAYPVLSNSSLSELFKKEAFDRVAAFQEEILASRGPDTTKFSLETDYTREESTQYITYVFSTYMYTGGAHYNQFHTTTTFDKNGEIVTLETLFTDMPAALKAISTYAKAQRAETEFNTELWLSGLDPNADAYSRYIIRDNSIEFIFDPYEIAPYSSGPQKIIVPKSVYQQYLK
jgi:hypothetical protein